MKKGLIIAVGMVLFLAACGLKAPDVDTEGREILLQDDFNNFRSTWATADSDDGNRVGYDGKEF